MTSSYVVQQLCYIYISISMRMTGNKSITNPYNIYFIFACSNGLSRLICDTIRGFLSHKIEVEKTMPQWIWEFFFRTFAESYFKVILTDKNIGITFYLIMVVFEIITLFRVWMEHEYIGCWVKEETFYWDFC